MKSKFNPNAGLISVIVAAIVVVLCYTLFGTVDIVFTQNDNEFYSQRNVGMFTEFELPEGEFSYTVNGKSQKVDEVGDLRMGIATVLFDNFINHRWESFDNRITVEKK